MEPRIQYAQTKDGVSIACNVIGEGMPLVYMTLGGFSHIQLEWEYPELRRFYERWAQKRMLVRYDSRGSGLSDRQASDYSLEAHLLDLEAVVDRLGLERFALLPAGVPGPVAIAYAVRHPERVSHLVLWCTYSRASDFWESPQVRGMVALLDTDWELGMETAAHSVVGWSEGEMAHRFAAVMRESTTPEAMRENIAACSEIDVTELLPEVKSPTLVCHRRHMPVPDVAVARGLASKIPDARLVLLEGDAMGAMVGDWEAEARTIDEFLGEGEEAAAVSAGARSRGAGGLVTILFTDVEGSTALTQRLGDAGARDILREHERIVREALKAHGGSEVKALGDGFMTSFSSATKALECAIAMQRAFAAHNETSDEPIHVRVGLNAGEPIAEDDPDGRGDLYGTAVNEAARITATAEGGEILVSNVVRELAKGKDFQFSDVGDRQLKGFDEPVRLFEAWWRDED